MRLSPLSQVRSAITGKNRFPVTIRQIQVGKSCIDLFFVVSCLPPKPRCT